MGLLTEHNTNTFLFFSTDQIFLRNNKYYPFGLNWTEVQPYNIICSFGTLKEPSAYIVGPDFNPVNVLGIKTKPDNF